jgi:hypothetical protein
MAMARPQSIVKMDDQDSVNMSSINMLVYSHPGEGKTPFWGTGGQRLLLMDSDHGYESAAALGSQASRASVTDYEELDEIYTWLLSTNCKEFDWVVWDSLTLFQERVLIDDIMVDAVAENPNQDEFVPSQRQYLINMNKVGRYVRNFVELPINFGISCHVDAHARDPEGNSVYMPLIQGKNMPSRISGYMNVIGFLGKAQVEEGGNKKTVQRMLLKKKGKMYARDRFMALGSHMDYPSIPKIEAAITAKRAEQAAKKVAPAKRTVRRTVSSGGTK